MRPALWARRAVYLCALLGALAGQLFDVGWIFHYIFFLTLTLPVLSLLLSLPGILGLRLHLSADGCLTPRDTPAAWTLTAANRFGLPVSRVTGRVKLRCPFTGESRSFPVGLQGASPGASAVWNVVTSHCGLVECSVSRLRAWDCLGLSAFPLGAFPGDTLLITPHPEEPERLILPESMGSTVPVPKGKASLGEDYELRPYREGDSLRSVHWKMSAKRDELITRELLAEKFPLPILTFDHFGSLDAMDRTLDRLAGYSRALLEHERPHAVRWLEPRSGAAREWAVASREDWLRCLAAIYADPVPQDGAAIGSLGYGGEDFLQIHITGTGEPLCPEK